MSLENKIKMQPGRQLCYVVFVVVVVSSFRCVDMVKSSQYVELANDLEINKAITYLRQKDFNQVAVCPDRIKGNTTQFTPLVCIICHSIVLIFSTLIVDFRC